MTDKQIPNERRLYEYKSVYPEKSIIIDDVDVSGCKWFTHNQLCECAIKPADDFHCHANPNCYYKKWQRKEQECEDLKEEIKKHNDDMFKNPPEKRFYCKGCTLPYISKKLKQTLTEIKNKLTVHKTLYYESKLIEKLHKEILQKISECEGNDE